MCLLSVTTHLSLEVGGIVQGVAGLVLGGWYFILLSEMMLSPLVLSWERGSTIFSAYAIEESF